MISPQQKNTEGQQRYHRRNGVRNFRVTIERRDGTRYVRDVFEDCPKDAKMAVLVFYREKYGAAGFGDEYWVQHCVEVKREGVTP